MGVSLDKFRVVSKDMYNRFGKFDRNTGWVVQHTGLTNTDIDRLIDTKANGHTLLNEHLPSSWSALQM